MTVNDPRGNPGPGRWFSLIGFGQINATSILTMAELRALAMRGHRKPWGGLLAALLLVFSPIPAVASGLYKLPGVYLSAYADSGRAPRYFAFTLEPRSKATERALELMSVEREDADIRSDKARIIKLARQGAREKDPVAHSLMGFLTRHDWPEKTDLKDSYVSLQRAALHGEGFAEFQLGEMVERGRVGPKVDAALELEIKKTAALKPEHRFDGPSSGPSGTTELPMAGHGTVVLALNAARMQEKFSSGTAKDANLGRAWIHYIRAAKMGSFEALTRIAHLLIKGSWAGIGVESDNDKGMKLLKSAADRGWPRAVAAIAHGGRLAEGWVTKADMERYFVGLWKLKDTHLGAVSVIDHEKAAVIAPGFPLAGKPPQAKKLQAERPAPIAEPARALLVTPQPKMTSPMVDALISELDEHYQGHVQAATPYRKPRAAVVGSMPMDLMMCSHRMDNRAVLVRCRISGEYETPLNGTREQSYSDDFISAVDPLGENETFVLGYRKVGEQLARKLGAAKAEREAALREGPEKAAYRRICANCHETGILGAPKFSDRPRWSALLKEKGIERMLENTDKGNRGMPARGGCTSCTDKLLGRLVHYMVYGSPIPPAPKPPPAPRPRVVHGGQK